MEYIKLGSSKIDVSRICLGSMTWGLQNDQSDADQQIAYALSQGVNFIDTAEMYAVPPSAETYGKTEAIIGHWLAENKNQRNNIVLATKIAGNGLPWVRNGENIQGQDIINAVDDSLKRLQTDYIDLYQIHWPNRTSPHFGKHWPNKIAFTDVDTEQQNEEMLSLLTAVQHCIKQGKIKHFGLSNETPWGIHNYLKLSAQHNLPKPVSIQNEFNLLHHKDWPYLIEMCAHENIAYLPWSPLAGGMLSGKYINGERPEGSRFTFMQRNGFFRDTPKTQQAIVEYTDLAKQHNLSPAQLALAWCAQVDGVSSTIIGATNLVQLKENIAAFSLSLNETLLTELNAIIQRYPAPF